MAAFAPEQFSEVLIFLATAGVAVPLFRRLRISPVLGFLAAGALLGPHALGQLAKHNRWLAPFSLNNIEQVKPIAEFGVVFLLFMIGLELSWPRLAIIGRLAFHVGAMQLIGSALVLAAFSYHSGAAPASAVVFGLALALSSTALVIPVLAENKRLATTAGRTIFAVLLFQDLMVAPLLFIVDMLSMTNASPALTMLTAFIPALAGLGATIFGGRFVIRPLFRHVAAARSTESFMAACFLVIIGTGFVTAMSGLSMGLGAFIAGILLAETEYNREIELTIDPFKGLLLGLFFLSVGASLDFSRLISDPTETIGVALAFVFAKFCINWLAGLAARLPSRVSTEAALLLAPGGEFAFALIAAAASAQIFPPQQAPDLLVAVTLSMFAIPILGFLAKTWLARPAGMEPVEPAFPSPDGPQVEAIIVGFGRVGQLVAEMLKAHGISHLAVDTDPDLVKRLRSEGRAIWWGNAARPEFLAKCGLSKAKALILTMDSPRHAESIVQDARRAYPNLTIVARARDAQHATALYSLGVSDAVPETIEASLQLSEALLVDMGVPMGKVIASIHEKRDEIRKILQAGADAGVERSEAIAHYRARRIRRRQPEAEAKNGTIY